MEDLGIKSLVNREVVDAEINDEHDIVVLTTKTGTLYLTWSGDCCARCFLANVNNSDALIGSTIISVEHTEWNTLKESDPDNYEVKESMGTTIKTTRGTVTFESRLEHNGYYSGYIQVSDIGPKDEIALQPLKDF